MGMGKGKRDGGEDICMTEWLFIVSYQRDVNAAPAPARTARPLARAYGRHSFIVIPCRRKTYLIPIYQTVLSTEKKPFFFSF